MLNNPQFDEMMDPMDNVAEGITREKLIQAFQILGIPVGEENINSRGEIIDELSVDDLNNPEYWNDKRPAPSRMPRAPLYEPEMYEDPANDVPVEPKTDWDMPRNAVI